MGTTRFFTGTSQDGTRYDFVEETSDTSEKTCDAESRARVSSRYRLSRDGACLTRVSESEFKIDKSGVSIVVR